MCADILRPMDTNIFLIMVASVFEICSETATQIFSLLKLFSYLLWFRKSSRLTINSLCLYFACLMYFFARQIRCIGIRPVWHSHENQNHEFLSINRWLRAHVLEWNKRINCFFVNSFSQWTYSTWNRLVHGSFRSFCPKDKIFSVFAQIHTMQKAQNSLCSGIFSFLFVIKKRLISSLFDERMYQSIVVEVIHQLWYVKLLMDARDRRKKNVKTNSNQCSEIHCNFRFLVRTHSLQSKWKFQDILFLVAL